MRAYINEVWGMLGNLFTEYKVSVIPRKKNQVADSLAITAGNFKVPIYSKKKYKIAIANRPSIIENSKYCQVFEYHLHIIFFFGVMRWVCKYIDRHRKPKYRKILGKCTISWRRCWIEKV